MKKEECILDNILKMGRIGKHQQKQTERQQEMLRRL